jgi:hypothetical protein
LTTHATLRLTLTVALGAIGVPASPAPQAATPRGGGGPLAVTHDAVTCMVAGRHPLIDADLTPPSLAQDGRVYFHSSLSDAFYYVEMKRAGSHFVGTLPRPLEDAGPVTYYVEGLARDHTQVRTGEVQAQVVTVDGQCEGRLAAYLPGTAPVRVFSLGGSTELPAGFGGVGSVVATTASVPGAGAASTGAAVGLAAPPSTARTDRSVSRKTAAILLGVGAIGLAATAAVLVSGEEPPPASPSR